MSRCEISVCGLNQFVDVRFYTTWQQLPTQPWRDSRDLHRHTVGVATRGVGREGGRRAGVR
jgi:hypothetical protein